MRTNGRRVAFFAAILTLALAGPALAADDRLAVHEWGTFTCLQNERGIELPGINVDDEPVPKFVHNLAPYILSKTFQSDPHWQSRQKATPRSHPLVTMRLETPVLYFYPPAGQTSPTTIDVRVRFRGGWLTEFYPEAAAEGPELLGGTFQFRNLSRETMSGLTWNQVQIGTQGEGPATEEHVWLAPRKVAAAQLTAEGGESEKYLFYRGVARLRAPLRVLRGADEGQLEIHGNFDEVLAADDTESIAHAWLVEVNADGTGRFRRSEPWTVTADPEVRVGRMHLDSLKQPHGNMEQLHDEMHAALVQEGLFDDEATAMLATWRRAYFRSPGERLFFLVPRRWTDHYLPLELSKPADVQRVLMARIELVTKAQRTILSELAESAPASADWIEAIPDGPALGRFRSGRIDFGDLGVEIPADFRRYLELGRFRNALILEEDRVRPSENLGQFIANYALQPFLPAPAKKEED